jgi:hypothetical protein
MNTVDNYIILIWQLSSKFNVLRNKTSVIYSRELYTLQSELYCNSVYSKELIIYYIIFSYYVLYSHIMYYILILCIILSYYVLYYHIM